jgi:hypothetical protein
MSEESRTIEQRIAEKEAELARLREQKRKEENGQKIILGGLLLNAAKTEPRIRDWLLKTAQEHITREVDKKRLAPLLVELKQQQAQPAPTQTSLSSAE